MLTLEYSIDRMATVASLYGSVIPVNIRSNNTQCSEMVVQCEREWNVERVKQEIEQKHPGHYPTQSQVIYYCGRRIPDSELLTSLFRREETQPPNTNPQHTLWLAVVMENKVFQEFLSLPKSDTVYSEVEYPNTPDNTHPYISALKYYNYLTRVQSQMKTSGKDAETFNQPKTVEGDSPPPVPNNPAGDNAEQGAAEGGPEQEEDAFNFLGGRFDRAQPIGQEEAQEQNAIFNAIYLLVRLSFFLYITYHYAPQYKFYLVIGFCAVMFIYQIGLFRINRVNIRRYQVVEEEVRARGEEGENADENTRGSVSENVGEKTPESTESVTKTPEITPKTEETLVENDEIRIAEGVVGEVREDTPIPSTNQGNSMLGVVKSLATLLYNLFLSFNPEFNVQEVQ